MKFVRRTRRVVYANPWISFEAHDIVHPNGSPGEHGLVSTPPASAVVVYDGAGVWFTRQARFAVDEVVLEIVKGGAEPGETPLAAAQRETREEIGFAAARWDDLGSVYELPSLVSKSVALFLARELTEVPTDREAVESIDAVRLPLEEAVAAALSGEIRDAVTGIALLRAARIIAGRAEPFPDSRDARAARDGG